MAIQYSTAYRTSAMSNLNTTIGTNAQIIIYSGTAPANVATAPTGTALVTFTGGGTSFGTASAGQLAMGNGTGSGGGFVASATAANTGTAGYFRINTSGGTAVLQGTVGTSGTDMIVTNTSINSSQTCQLTSLTITAYGA